LTELENSEYIKEILEEFYNEFVVMYDEKHSKRVKEKLTELNNKIVYKPNEVSQNLAACAMFLKNKEDISSEEIWFRVLPTDKKFKSVLKHEIWHILGGFERTDIPSKYVNIDTSKRLVSENEKWTEWLSKSTHLNDMEFSVKKYKMGYFSINNTSNSGYDKLVNIADISSFLIGKEKILEAYLNLSTYKTDITFEDIIEEFDEKYQEALNSEEKEKYKYPYLKLLKESNRLYEIDIKNEKSKKNEELELVNSIYKTLTNAYLIKLKDISKEENIDLEKLTTICNEIKSIEKYMPHHTLIKGEQRLECYKNLDEIKNSFIDLCNQISEKDNLNIEELEKVKREILEYNFFEKVDGIENVLTEDFIYTTILEKNDKDKFNLYNTMKFVLGKDKEKMCYKNLIEKSDLYISTGRNLFKEWGNSIIEISEINDEKEKDNKMNDLYFDMYKIYLDKLDKRYCRDIIKGINFNEFGDEKVNIKAILYANPKGLGNVSDVISKYADIVDCYINNVEASIDKESLMNGVAELENFYKKQIKEKNNVCSEKEI